MKLHSNQAALILPAVLGCLACQAGTPAAEDAVLQATNPPPTVSVPGTRFPAVVVTARNQRGEPLAGRLVIWSGDGEVVAIDSITDSTGQARASWTLPRFRTVPGPLPSSGPSGTFQLKASLPGMEPVVITTRARVFTADKIWVAYGYACGLRSATVWCWGSSIPISAAMQHSSVPLPVTVPSPDSPIELSLNELTLCARTADGSVYCDGAGNGFDMKQIDGLPPMSALASEERSQCGLAATDGTLWCWLEGADAQPMPRQISSQRFTELSAGYNSMCMLDPDGQAWCLGSNRSGQLGTGGSDSASAPVAVATPVRFASLQVMGQQACGITADHAAWCWGAGGLSADPVRLPQSFSDVEFAGGGRLIVGDQSIYVLRSGRLSQTYHGQPEPLDLEFNALPIADFSDPGQVCLLTLDHEVYCSWVLLTGLADGRVLSAWPIPVPWPDELE